jgi:hypothetical protein
MGEFADWITTQDPYRDERYWDEDEDEDEKEMSMKTKSTAALATVETAPTFDAIETAAPDALAVRRIAAIAEVLTQSTPKAEIRERPGKGGKKLKYTDGAYVIRTLNNAFCWDWDWEIDDQEAVWINDKPFEVRCRGKLTVRLDGRTIVKTQFGSQPIEFLRNSNTPVSIGDAYKGAATDALKKCASLLGIALDLYDSDSDVNTGHGPGNNHQSVGNNTGNHDSARKQQQQASSGDQPGTPRGKQLFALKAALSWDDAAFLSVINQECGSMFSNATDAADLISVAEQKVIVEKLQLELKTRNGRQ